MNGKINRLIVDTDELQLFIKKIKLSSEDVTKSIQKIQEIANTIPEAWEGTDATTYIDNFNSYLEKLNQIPTFYSDIYNEMDILNKEYNDKDIELATKVDRGGY